MSILVDFNVAHVALSVVLDVKPSAILIVRKSAQILVRTTVYLIARMHAVVVPTYVTLVLACVLVLVRSNVNRDVLTVRTCVHGGAIFNAELDVDLTAQSAVSIAAAVVAQQL